MKDKVLITGGTGFIGSAIVKMLVRNGYLVRVLDNQSRGSINRLDDIKERFEMVKGDIRNPKDVNKACQNIDSVIHLAYINGTEFFYSKPELVLEVGVKGMINILDGCIKNKIKNFFLASSSEVYQTPPIIPTPETVPLIVPDPLNPRYSYGGGKIISELMAINYGRKFFKKVVIFRPHNVYGPDMGWEHVIPQLISKLKKNFLKKSILPIQGTGKETRAFMYIDDFVNGFEVIYSRGKNLEIYNIGIMEEVTIQQLIEKIAGILSIQIDIIPSELPLGSTKRRCPDTTKLNKLGFKSLFSLEEGLRKTIQWYNASAHL